MSGWQQTKWAPSKKIGSHFYSHLSNYFTTVKREAERQKSRMEKYPGMIVKIVKMKMVGKDGISRDVYSLYARSEN